MKENTWRRFGVAACVAVSNMRSTVKRAGSANVFVRSAGKCRKVSGTSGNAVFYVAANNLIWLHGTEQIKTYEVPDRNGWKSVFCRECGCPMPLLDRNSKIYYVPAGSLDDDPGHRGVTAHIFVGSKAPWVVITDDAPQYTEGIAETTGA